MNKLTLIDFLKWRTNQNKSDRLHYRFQLWVNKERRNFPKSLDTWRDLWNDFNQEVNQGINTPLNLRPNRRY